MCAMLAIAAACGPSRDQMSVAQVEALRQSIAKAGGAGAGPGAAASPGAGGSPAAAGGAAGAAGGRGDASPGGPPEGPPPSRAELERRARAALGPGRSASEPVLAGDGTRYAFVFEERDVRAQERLVLLDLWTDPGLVIGEHDFGPSDAVTEGDPAPLEASGVDAELAGSTSPVAPATPDSGEASLASPRIARALEIVSDSGEPVLLAEISRGTGTVACGWWLRRRGTTFVCAPRMAATSTYRAVDGVLVETWQASLAGTGGVEGVSGASGRIFRILGGRWREADEFHCLGWPLEAALQDAGAPGLAAWQTAAVRQRIAAARRASAALETDPAIALLRDAVRIDGCDATAWRFLGRLEFERGRAALAAPALAVALALDAREPASLVDLADALAVLNPAPGAGAAGLEESIAALEGHGATRAIVERARRESGAATPRALAVALYETYLERTSPDDPRVEAARRRASEQIADLRRSPRAPARPTRGKPAAAKKPAKSGKAAAKPDR